MKRCIVVLLLMCGAATPAKAQDQNHTDSGRHQPRFLAASELTPAEPAVSTPAAAAPQGNGSSASAERKGFIIGVGGGVAFKRESTYEFRNRTFQLVDSNATGLLTDFKVGYAISDQLLVYYTNQVAWGSNAGFDAIGVSGAGVTYMLKPTTPSIFVTGAVGGSVGAQISTTSTTSVGLGVSLGGGYEFARHYSIGGRWLSLDIGQPKRSQVFGITFDWLFY